MYRDVVGERIKVVPSYSLGEKAGAGVGFAWAAGHWRVHGDSKGAVVVLPEQRCALIGCVCVCVCVFASRDTACAMLTCNAEHTHRTATCTH